MGKSAPGKGNSFVDIIQRMKARGPYLGNQIGKCLRHVRTAAGDPRNDIQLCLLDSETYSASQSGRDLTKEFQVERAQAGWLHWWEVLNTQEWINPPFAVLVDWESGVIARESLTEFGCLADVEQCLYEEEGRHKFVRLKRSSKPAFVPQGPLEDVAAVQGELDTLPPTTRKTLVDARCGQGTYRDELIRLWGRCGVTGCKTKQLLRASHIKPWRLSNDHERLDRFNGLLLTPILDFLFDGGFISFADNGRIMFSPKLRTDDADLLGVDAAMKLCYVYEENKPYLSEHRRLFGFGAE